MRLHSIFICLILLTSSMNGQETFDIDGFLSGVREDESVVFQREKMYYLGSLPHHLSRIEKLEFRTETNDFNLARQEYVFRVSPNSLKNVKTQRSYHQTVKYMTEMELEEALGKALKTRYDLVVNCIYLEEVLAIKNKLNILSRDKVSMLNRSISLPDFEVLDLIEAQDEKQANVRDILDLENEIMTCRKMIQRISGTKSTIRMDKDSLINIEELKDRIAVIRAEEPTTHSLLKVQSAKLYNNMLEYEWESAKSKFSIGYVQAKYGYNPDDGFKETFSLGIGFDIPLKNSANLTLNELLIKKLASESEYRNIKTQLDNEKFILFQQLENAIQKYELVNNQLEEGQAEFVIQEYTKIAEASPAAILKLRENTLKNELLLKELEWEIMQTYVAYLGRVGVLNQWPLKNYLSKGLNGF